MKNKLKRLILKIKLKLFQPNRIDYIFGSSTLPSAAFKGGGSESYGKA